MSLAQCSARGRLRSAAVVVSRTVEAKNLPGVHDLYQARDTFVVVALDQEEIFRTATAEKSLR